jgi:hypothetical protein
MEGRQWMAVRLDSFTMKNPAGVSGNPDKKHVNREERRRRKKGNPKGAPSIGHRRLPWQRCFHRIKIAAY